MYILTCMNDSWIYAYAQAYIHTYMYTYMYIICIYLQRCMFSSPSLRKVANWRVRFACMYIQTMWTLFQASVSKIRWVCVYDLVARMIYIFTWVCVCVVRVMCVVVHVCACTHTLSLTHTHMHRNLCVRIRVCVWVQPRWFGSSSTPGLVLLKFRKQSWKFASTHFAPSNNRRTTSTFLSHHELNHFGGCGVA